MCVCVCVCVRACVRACLLRSKPGSTGALGCVSGMIGSWPRMLCGFPFGRILAAALPLLCPLSQRGRMLYRIITSTFAWKVSAWPFQMSVAQETDTVQCQMLCKILPCAPRGCESIDCFDRRRKRNARLFVMKLAYGSCYGLPARCHVISTWSVVPHITISEMTC